MAQALGFPFAPFADGIEVNTGSPVNAKIRKAQVMHACDKAHKESEDAAITNAFYDNVYELLIEAIHEEYIQHGNRVTIFTRLPKNNAYKYHNQRNISHEIKVRLSERIKREHGLEIEKVSIKDSDFCLNDFLGCATFICCCIPVMVRCCLDEHLGALSKITFELDHIQA